MCGNLFRCGNREFNLAIISVCLSELIFGINTEKISIGGIQNLKASYKYVTKKAAVEDFLIKLK